MSRSLAAHCTTSPLTALTRAAQGLRGDPYPDTPFQRVQCWYSLSAETGRRTDQRVTTGTDRLARSLLSACRIGEGDMFNFFSLLEGCESAVILSPEFRITYYLL